MIVRIKGVKVKLSFRKDLNGNVDLRAKVDDVVQTVAWLDITLGQWRTVPYVAASIPFVREPNGRNGDESAVSFE